MPPDYLNPEQEKHGTNNLFHWVWEQECCPPSCRQALWWPAQLDLLAEVHPPAPAPE